MKNRVFKLIAGIITITMGLALITGCSKTSSGDVKIVKIGNLNTILKKLDKELL